MAGIRDYIDIVEGGHARTLAEAWPGGGSGRADAAEFADTARKLARQAYRALHGRGEGGEDVATLARTLKARAVKAGWGRLTPLLDEIIADPGNGYEAAARIDRTVNRDR